MPCEVGPGRDHLDPERTEHQRQDDRGRRVGVVDDESEPPFLNDSHVECGEEISDVGLGRAGGEREVAEVLA